MNTLDFGELQEDEIIIPGEKERAAIRAAFQEIEVQGSISEEIKA